VDARVFDASGSEKKPHVAFPWLDRCLLDEPIRETDSLSISGST
jgi:hypothetical protein